MHRSRICSIVLFVIAITFNALISSARAQATTKAVDPTTVEPANADVMPSLEEVRKHLGAPSPDPQIALWLSESYPEILFIAVRLDKPRELRASSGGDDLSIKPLGDPKDLTYVAASRQPAWKQATTNVWVSYKDENGKHMIIGPKNAKGLPESPVWRGPEAPKAPEEVRELAGQVRKY